MKQIIFLLLLVSFFYACESNSDKNSLLEREKQIASNDMEEIKNEDSTITGFQTSSADQKFKQSPEPVKIDWNKKIVKTANLRAETKNYKEFSKKLYEKTKQFGGYVSIEQQNSSDYKIENTITIKVPVDQFENAVNSFLEETVKVDEKNINSEDVTTEFVDGRSRLEAKKQVRLRYLELLKGAKNMSDILEVQNEINTIQEDIEMVNGRLNFLGQASAMSTIQFTYYQVLNASAIKEADSGFFSKLKSAFVNGWYWIGELFVGLMSIWPLLLAGIFGYFIVRKKFTTKPLTKSV